MEPGDTLSVAAGDTVQISVDVQAPDWVQFDRVELYSYAPGREAVDGASNDTWPDSRIAEIATVDPQTLPVEAVPGPGNLRRLHLTHTFTAQVQADTWFAVMVRSVSSGRSLQPLNGNRPWALSNAILVDADGSGAYDDFPLRTNKMRMGAPPPPKPNASRRVANRADIERLLLHGLHLAPEH